MTRTTWTCRRCAVVFAADSGTELPARPELERRLASPSKTERLTAHDCADGGYGVADLTGAIEQGERAR